MSQANLKRFLNKLHTELQASNAAKNYRTYTSNFKTHEFKLTFDELLAEALQELTENDIVIPKKARKEFDSKIWEFFREFKKELTRSLNTGSAGDEVLHGTSDSSTIHVVIKKYEKGRGRDAFSIITRARAKHLANLAVYLENTYYKPAGKSIYKSFPDRSGNKVTYVSFLDVTHGEGDEVSSQLVASQRREIAEKLNRVRSGSKTDKLVKDSSIELLLGVTKDPNRERLTVSLGSKTKNQQQGRTVDRKIKTEFEKALKDVVNSMEAMKLKGSDSLLETKKKKVKSKVMQAFKRRLKGKARISFKKPKIDKSVSKAKIDVSPKHKGSKKVPKKRLKTDRKQKADTLVNLRKLIPQINMQLHDEIREHMGKPSLQYQTGRFANSAKVVDIKRRKRMGYPTISYTYQRDPYQVFEYPKGSPNLATPERDPRNIIGGSVRAIAKKYINQRFYTKRV